MSGCAPRGASGHSTAHRDGGGSEHRAVFADREISAAGDDKRMDSSVRDRGTHHFAHMMEAVAPVSSVILVWERESHTCQTWSKNEQKER
jgi:hypothetical protein